MILGIDVGGTFTDVVAYDGRTIRTAKIPSAPHAPWSAVEEGVRLFSGARIACLVHGSTVATNAVLEGKGARVALVTTKGFRDVLEIGRQNRESLYDLSAGRPPPLVSRKDRHEVRERMTHEGETIVPLAMGEIPRKVRESGCDSVAVCFLHSYANPAHEKRAGGSFSGMHVSLSHEVLCEYREYERFSTTVLDAYTRPVMTDYLSRLSFPFPTYVMQSNGGILHLTEAAGKSVATLLSGPAAGVRGASYFSSLSGFPNLLTFDMGGTSTDVCLLEKGRARYTRATRVAGHPCALPMMDIHTVGAGGGSIAWRDSGGALHVGPQSAGADPGPACYGAGKYATVTDADLVLGYLDPAYFLGGRMRLHLRKAEKALGRLARLLDCTAIEACWGVFSIVNANMVGALKVISTQKGVDPKDFSLFAFGGAGPVHGAFLARELGIPRMVVPREPGVFSAFGLLVSDREKDFSCTRILPLDTLGDSEAREIFCSLQKEKGRYERSCEVRFVGQSHEIEIPFRNTKQLARDFCREHRRRYGYDARDRMEVVSFKARKIEKARKPPPQKIGRGTSKKARKGRRKAFFTDRFHAAAVYERRLLGTGSRIRGPAIVEEETATTVIPPGCTARVDSFGALIVEVST